MSNEGTAYSTYLMECAKNGRDPAGLVQLTKDGKLVPAKAAKEEDND